MEEYIDKLVNILYNEIDATKVTILTGRNAGGKSLIRKQLVFPISKQLDKKKVNIPHASQQLRTDSQPELGAFSGFAHDLPWLATSDTTITTIENVFKLKETADYLVIDEPEIGLGEELQLGLCDYLNEQIEECKKLGKGVLIICHSRIIANNINHDVFINLEGMTKDEWVNRVPEKISVSDFNEFAKTMFAAVRDRQNSNKKDE